MPADYNGQIMRILSALEVDEAPTAVQLDCFLKHLSLVFFPGNQNNISQKIDFDCGDEECGCDELFQKFSVGPE